MIMDIQNLYDKRASLVKDARNFLDTHTDKDGQISADDAAAYEKMEDEIVKLGENIKRFERNAKLSAELSAISPQSAMMKRMLSPSNNAVENVDKSKLISRAFNKLVINPVRNEPIPLTDDERNAYYNVTGSPGAPAQIETTPSLGGYLVPEEQMNTLQEFRKDFVALKDYVSVININTPAGRWATYSPEDLEFQPFVEMADIAESDVTFGQATFVVEDRGLILPVSNQLIADANIDIIGFLGRQLAQAAVRTENKEILKPLNKLITGDTESAIAAATTVTSYKALNQALFKTLDATYLQAARIFTNQDGFLWLQDLDDGTNRPLITPDVTLPNTYRYRGKEIVVISNSTLPSTASGAKNYAPFFVGDMRSYLTFFERQGIELATSRELYFRKAGMALRATIRFGVVVTDKDAITAFKVEV